VRCWLIVIEMENGEPWQDIEPAQAEEPPKKEEQRPLRNEGRSRPGEASIAG
jgi:hypothetical protein